MIILLPHERELLERERLVPDGNDDSLVVLVYVNLYLDIGVPSRHKPPPCASSPLTLCKVV